MLTAPMLRLRLKSSAPRLAVTAEDGLYFFMATSNDNTAPILMWVHIIAPVVSGFVVSLGAPGPAAWAFRHRVLRLRAQPPRLQSPTNVEQIPFTEINVVTELPERVIRRRERISGGRRSELSRPHIDKSSDGAVIVRL